MDVQVLFDKLAGLGEAADIAELFEEVGIQGVQNTAEACAIAIWFRQADGLYSVEVGETIACSVRADEISYGLLHQVTFMCTGPMKNFIENFDNGLYPRLVQEEECSCCDEGF